jgi:AbiV family abortive infection protein
MINLKKLQRMSLLALDNAIRLHGDALSLYKDQRYPSAFLLSVLSQEEIGKAHMISRYVWSCKETGHDASMEKLFLDNLYKHPLKQGAFLSNSNKGFALLKTEKGRKIYQGVFSGELESKKQTATYVGLRKIKKVVDVKGRIQRPHQITRKQTHTQVSNIHDYLVDACVGIIADQYDFEIDDIKRVFNRRLYKQLRLSWSVTDPTIKEWIINATKFLKKEKMKPL